MTRKFLKSLLLASAVLLSLTAAGSLTVYAQDEKPTLFNKLRNTVAPSGKITPFDMNRTKPTAAGPDMAERKQEKKDSMLALVAGMESQMQQMAQIQIAAIPTYESQAHTASAPQQTKAPTNKVMVYDPAKVKKAKTPTRLYNPQD